MCYFLLLLTRTKLYLQPWAHPSLQQTRTVSISEPFMFLFKYSRLQYCTFCLFRFRTADMTLPKVLTLQWGRGGAYPAEGVYTVRGKLMPLLQGGDSPEGMQAYLAPTLRTVDSVPIGIFSESGTLSGPIQGSNISTCVWLAPIKCESAQPL